MTDKLLKVPSKSLPPWDILHAFLLSADFIQNQLFRKILSGIPSEYHSDWIQIRPKVLSILFAKDINRRCLIGNELTLKQLQLWIRHLF